ncbi:response regulator [Sphingomonas adhaesiva]|uniref:response regulator n=1 Tax=Sphingomonas adhaesiva TaxID=28212 RepID=UPI002FF7A15F
MADPLLRERHILIVEDEYLLADELRMELEEVGAIVVGPAGSVSDALALIGSDAPIDGAILDVNLGGQLAFPVADRLVRRGVPTVFTTGYDEAAIPDRFAAVERCRKPVNIRLIMGTMRVLIDRARRGGPDLHHAIPL